MALTRIEIAASVGGTRLPRVAKMTFREKLTNLFKPYRPYKHYMRGPGPKCRRKEADGDADHFHHEGHHP
jgi:hypothetical protein